MTDKEIRALSRQLNKGKYFVSFSIVIYAVFTLGVFCILPYFGINLIKLFKADLDSINRFVFPAVCVLFMFFITAFSVFVFSSVSLGEKAWYGGRLTKKKMCGKRLRYWFMPKHSFKAVRFEILLFFIKLMWTIALFSPAALAFAGVVSLAYSGGIELYLFLSLTAGGIVLLTAGIIFRFFILQRYFLAPYLITRDPKLKPMQAIKQSKNLLDGHIFRIAAFKLKYLPSFLLYPLIIPAIFLYPNYKQGCSLIAKEICL